MGESSSHTLVVSNGSVVDGDEADAVVSVRLVSSLTPLVGSRATGKKKTSAAPVYEATAQPAHEEELAGPRVAQGRVAQEDPSCSHRKPCREV